MILRPRLASITRLARTGRRTFRFEIPTPQRPEKHACSGLHPNAHKTRVGAPGVSAAARGPAPLDDRRSLRHPTRTLALPACFSVSRVRGLLQTVFCANGPTRFDLFMNNPGLRLL